MGKKKKKEKKSSRSTSTLRQHKQLKKSLIPPMLGIPKMTPSSWKDDRMPEMLWACLVISVFPRTHALSAFREIASIGLNYRDTEGIGQWTLSHSQLPSLPPEIIITIVQIVTRHPLGYAALRPLLLFDDLPGRDRWAQALKVEVQQSDWQTLANAVLMVFDHQSQEATDVRWLTLMFKICLGVLCFPKDYPEELVKGLVEYPNEGEMRAIRPMIRAGELAVASISELGDSWCKNFWKECLDKTTCAPAGLPKEERPTYDPEASIKQIQSVYESLLAHWFDTLDTSGVDAKHDAAFGFGFYTLAVLLEMTVGGNGSGITGRALLRTLVECRITFAYLKSRGEPDLWEKFRAFGTGQAKLALLKLDEMASNKPSFVSMSVLQTLSNEDFFQEYVQIELGHWCGIDLRRMAELSGTKDDYDRVYAWASTFVHGHWSAIRDSCMTHCFNPLHRLHRVPLPGHRLLEDAVPEGVRLVNLILNDLGALYPQFDLRVELADLTRHQGGDDIHNFIIGG